MATNTVNVQPEDIIAAQNAIDFALSEKQRGVRLDLNPEYVNDPKKLATYAKDILNSYYEDPLGIGGQEKPILRPLLYTSGEMTERVAWTLLTDYGSTPTPLKVRDLNVLDYLQAFGDNPYFEGSGLGDFELYRSLEKLRQSVSAEAWQKYGPAIYAIFRYGRDYSKHMLEEEFISLTTNHLLGIDLLRISNFLLPVDVMIDYLNSFSKWWGKGKGIRSLLYKFFTGAISETEFNNAVLKFKKTDDYEDGFYDEEIEV